MRLDVARRPQCSHTSALLARKHATGNILRDLFLVWTRRPKPVQCRHASSRRPAAPPRFARSIHKRDFSATLTVGSKTFSVRTPVGLGTFRPTDEFEAEAARCSAGGARRASSPWRQVSRMARKLRSLTWTSIPSSSPGCSSPHDLFPHHFPRASPSGFRYIATLEILWGANGRERYSFWRDFWTGSSRLVRHGVVSGIVLVLPARHQLDRFSAAAGNIGGRSPATSHDGVSFSKRLLGILLSGIPRAALAARVLGPRVAVGTDLGASGSCGEQLDATRPPATRCAKESPIRSTGSPSSSIQASSTVRPHAQRRLPDAGFVCWDGAAATCWPTATRRRRTMLRMALASWQSWRRCSFHRRPARAQHARAPADSRSPPWRRTGTDRCPATSNASPGRTKRRTQSVRDQHPRALDHPHA